MIAPVARATAAYKRLDRRLGTAVKAAISTGALRLPFSGWSFALLPRTKFDYAAEVGSGTQNSALMAVVNWIMRNFPEARLMVEMRQKDRTWIESLDHAMAYLIEHPNPYYSGALLLMATLADFVVHGNAYWIIVRMRQVGPDGLGVPAQLWWIPQSLIDPVGGETLDNLIDHYAYTPQGYGEPVRLDSANVVHFRWGLDPTNILKGLSPVGALFREIFTDDEAANFTAAVLKNFGVPGVVITPSDADADITKADADQMRGDFTQRFTGDGRGGPFIASGKVDVKVLSFSPEQMQLTQVRRIPEERITAVLGIPAVVTGLGAGLDRSTYNNYEEARQAAFENGIIPLQRLIASDLDTQLLPSFTSTKTTAVRSRFDNAEVRVLQEDEDKRQSRILGQMAAGARTVASTQAALGIEVDDTQDVYLRGVSVAEVPANEVRETAPDALTQAETVVTDAAKALGLKADPVRARMRAIRAAEPKIRRELADLGRLAVRRVLADDPKGRKDVTTEPLTDADFADISRLLRGVQFDAVTRAYNDAAESVGVRQTYDPNVPDNAAVLDRLAKNVTSINEETRTQIRERVKRGLENGDSTQTIADDIEQLEAFAPSRAMKIARTEITNAENWSQVAAWKESGVVDDVRILDGDGCGWTDHDDPDLAHGTIRSLADFDAYPTAHPNAVLEGSSFASYGDVEEMIRARYSGAAIRLTAGVHVLTIGPNHPMLTQRGFVLARDLNKGDELVYDDRIDLATRAQPNLKHVQPVEQVAQALMAISTYSHVAATADDFHGDGAACYGEVDVIRPYGQLLNVLDLGTIEHRRELALVGANAQAEMISSLRTRELSAYPIMLAASGLVSGAGDGIDSASHYRFLSVEAVESVHFEGWAFDATTHYRLYNSGGFVVSNCVRVGIPNVKAGSRPSRRKVTA